MSDEIAIAAASRADAAGLTAMMERFNVEDGQPPGRYTTAGVLRDGFGPEPAFSALIAWQGGAAVGYALTCPMYNTDLARRGLWLADLWVEPAHRSRKIGRQLIAAVAKAALDGGGASVWWGVRDTNRRGRAFYFALGAGGDDARILGLEGAALTALAAEASGSR